MIFNISIVSIILSIIHVDVISSVNINLLFLVTVGLQKGGVYWHLGVRMMGMMGTG